MARNNSHATSEKQVNKSNSASLEWETISSAIDMGDVCDIVLTFQKRGEMLRQVREFCPIRIAPATLGRAVILARLRSNVHPESIVAPVERIPTV